STPCGPLSNLLSALSAGALHGSTKIGYHFSSLLSRAKAAKTKSFALRQPASSQQGLRGWQTPSRDHSE
ncbi:MAG: hypothetical protein WB763_19275, partial [Terriglobia bacterium]